MKNFSCWFNLKAAFVARFGQPERLSKLKETIFSFKQTKGELLILAWERFRRIAYGTEHGLRDWMLMHTFYSGLTNSSKAYLDIELECTFMNLTARSSYILSDGLLLEAKK